MGSVWYRNHYNVYYIHALFWISSFSLCRNHLLCWAPGIDSLDILQRGESSVEHNSKQVHIHICTAMFLHVYCQEFRTPDTVHCCQELLSLRSTVLAIRKSLQYYALTRAKPFVLNYNHYFTCRMMLLSYKSGVYCLCAGLLWVPALPALSSTVLSEMSDSTIQEEAWGGLASFPGRFFF